MCTDCGKHLIRHSFKRCRQCYLLHIRSNIGKRIIDVGRYTRIKIPNHPKANKTGYISEHRYVWEMANGKPLPDGWVIHHLNGIPHDNRIENLVALPEKKHRRILAAKAKRIQELEALLLKQGQLM